MKKFGNICEYSTAILPIYTCVLISEMERPKIATSPSRSRTSFATKISENQGHILKTYLMAIGRMRDSSDRYEMWIWESSSARGFGVMEYGI